MTRLRKYKGMSRLTTRSQTHIIVSESLVSIPRATYTPVSLCFNTKATLFNKILSPTGNSSIKCPHKRCYNETILQTKRGGYFIMKRSFYFP